MNAMFQIPPQPDLRAFIVYDRVPDGCLVHQVTDDVSEPLLHEGERIIVDAADRVPMPGELFLIEYGSAPRPRRRIVQLIFRTIQVCCTDADGRNVSREELVCWAAAHTAPKSLAEFELQCREQRLSRRPILLSDGPYALNEQGTNEYLEEQLIGKIVGIYDPEPGGDV
nr:hypothetical protein [uncultured Acidocella sp.]